MAASSVHLVLWGVFAIMAASTGFFYFLASPKPSSERSFHYITGAITMIAAISCGFGPPVGSTRSGSDQIPNFADYTMAGDYGVVTVGDRPFYYAR